MSDESEKLASEREAITAVLQSVDPFSEQDDAPEGSILTGWVVVGEYMDTDGDKWLSHFSGDANGSKNLPSWTVQGFCHDVLAREAAK